MNNFNTGNIVLEILVSNPEAYLNALWKRDINIFDIKKKTIKKLVLTIEYNDYEEVEEVTKRFKGKIKIVSKRGKVVLINKIKSKKTLVIGVFLFLGILYFLSSYIWAIEIKTEENVTPYEIRQDLKKLGIKPGMRKSSVDVYKLEKQLEGINSDVLWLRIRIEGSTLKVLIEEKINPPHGQEVKEGDSIAKMPGEIKRIYVTSGTAAVSPGDFVNEGDVLISSFQGKEGEEYSVPAKGVVIANTFYERVMEVQISGDTLVRTGKKDKDIYLNLFGVKLYLKKAINNFENYDKIEGNKKFYNNIDYYEKKKKSIEINKDEAIKNATIELEKSLTKNLSNEAIISDKNVYVEDIEGGKIRVKVMFIVEQNIVFDNN